MKKLLTSFTLGLCFVFTVSGQDQHKWFAGGELGFSSNDNHSHFNIGPGFGCWLNDNMALWGAVSFGSHTTKGVTDLTRNTFKVGAEFRYGWHSGDNLFLYLAPGASYQTAKDDTDNADATNTFYVGIAPGLEYMISDKWSLNSHFGNLGYTSTTVGDGDAFGTFDLNLDLNHINLGLNFHF